MSVQIKFERSLLSHDEFEVIRLSHYPGIEDVSGQDLHTARVRLRDMRDKERTHARQKRREVRGKATPRGGSFPGTAERPLERKQVFAAALKRVNKEFTRREKFEAWKAHVDAAHRALAMKQAGSESRRPPESNTANNGMRPAVSNRRRTRVSPSKIGSVSQATKRAQAIRDGG